jgi:hypothetical protein
MHDQINYFKIDKVAEILAGNIIITDSIEELKMTFIMEIIMVFIVAFIVAINHIAK